MNPQVSLSPEWSPLTRRIVALLALAAAVALLFFVQEILPLVIVSALLAFLLNPLVTWLQKRVLRLPFPGQETQRGCAVALAFLLVICLFSVIILVVVPGIVAQVEEFGETVPALLSDAEEELERILSEPLTFNGVPVLLDGRPLIPLERIAEMTGTTDLRQIIRLSDLDFGQAAGAFLSSARSLTGPAFSFLGSAFNTVINLIFLVMMTFYMLRDGHRFVAHVLQLAPEGYEDDTARLLAELGLVWSAYIRGQIILCVTMGVVVYVTALALGVPGAPILGLLSGLLEFIPNLGPFLALIPAALMALVNHSTTIPFLEGIPFMMVVIVVWTMLQNLEAVFLVPRIMGSSLELHPLAVIISVLAGAALAGPLGVILASPTLASARVIARYVYGKLTHRPPFPERTPLSTPPPLLARPALWLRTVIDTALAKRRKSIADKSYTTKA